MNAISTYGAWVVVVRSRSRVWGFPFTHVVLAAVIGGIADDNAGFWIGRTAGLRWVMRHPSRLGLITRQLKLGQYLFLRHGGKVVFFGRFIAVLRALAAFLAGLNGMDGDRFMIFNASGAIVWASAYGIVAYVFGATLANALRSIGVVLGIATAAAVAAALVMARRFERRLEDKAEDVDGLRFWDGQ
jgi:membrane protein DedA with SNARE-associated domain